MSSLRWALLAAMASACAGVASADDLSTTGGKVIKGKLVAVDGQGVTFSAGEVPVKVSAKDIVLIDLGNKIVPPAKDTRYHEVELTDGSTFRIVKYAIKGRKMEVEMLPGPMGVEAPRLDLGVEVVFSVMRGADDPANRDAWKKMLGLRGKRDLYVMREAGGLNFLQGTILSGSEKGDSVEFEKEDGTRTRLLLSRANGGLVFAHPQPKELPPTLCKIHDVFGNTLIARSVELNASGVSVTTVGGLVVKYPAVSALAKLDYAQGNVAYLSDLDPQVDAPEVPADEKGLRLEIVAPVIKDRGVAGDVLKIAGEQPFSKGLSIAPETRLTYNIGGDYRDFKAVAGLPDTVLDANLAVKLTIETDDGRVLFSEVIRRKDKARPLGLDVKGVKQLRLIVDADLPINGNRLILGDAKVQK
jgi:hypothetical protein